MSDAILSADVPSARIIGFRAIFGPQELQSHFETRASYHRGRAKLKRDELPKLQESLRVITQRPSTPENDDVGMSTMSFKNSSNYAMNPNDVVERAKLDIERHEKQAARFELLSKHVPPLPQLLTTGEMADLELIF